MVSNMAPGGFTDRGAGLPYLRVDVRELAALHIIHSGPFRKGIELVVYDRTLAPFGGLVVIISGQLLKVGLEDRLFNPPVEIQQLRPIAVNQITGADQPVVQKLLIRRQNRQRIGRITVAGLRRTVQVRVFRVLYI
ncbi:hypothetical protein D3C75_826990 [compost metagenome]